MVRRGELRAPIVIDRDHLDARVVASLYRETEVMADSSVLTTDPGTGVVRHADAGDVRALEVARERDIRMPIDELRA